MSKFRQLIKEEVVPNPQNPRAPMLFTRISRVAANDDPNSNEKTNSVLLTDKEKPASGSIFNAEELAAIEKMCPEFISDTRRGKSVSIQIKQDQIDSPETQAKITKLAQALSSIGNYGQVDPSSIMSVVKQTASTIIDSETLSGIHKDTLRELENYIMRMTSPDALEAMSKIKVFTPMNNISYQLSMRNIDLIKAQNSKRVAEGLPAATYIVAPDVWYIVFGRKIKPDAKPIYYWAPADTGYTLQNIIDAIDQLHGDKLSSSSDVNNYMYKLSGAKYRDPRNNILQTAKKKHNPNPDYYNIFPYYDITDTELINANDTDAWNDPDRVGVTDNIENIPTQAGLAQISGDDEESQKWMERLTSGEFTDNPMSAVEVCHALSHILKNNKEYRPRLEPDANGKINLEAVKESVFRGVTELAIQYYMSKGGIARRENCLKNAEMVACLYVGKHNIDSKKAANTFARLGKNVYYTGVVNGKEVNLTKDPKTGKFMYRKSQVSPFEEYTGEVKSSGFKEEITRISYELQNVLYYVDSTINNQLHADFERNGDQSVFNKYRSMIAEDFNRSITWDGLETYNDLGGTPEFRKMMNEVYNYIVKCNKYKLQEMKSRITEQEDDDWFAPELTGNDIDMGYENQGLNDFYNQKDVYSEAAKEDRVVAESNFYDIMNRIEKLY